MLQTEFIHTGVVKTSEVRINVSELHHQSAHVSKSSPELRSELGFLLAIPDQFEPRDSYSPELCFMPPEE